MRLISVVIPSYNSARYVSAAVESVLRQTMTDLEVIVVDDGSTDATRTTLDRYGPPLRYFHQPNAGVSIARNRGIEETSGRYVAFLDADDVWAPDKLERQLAELQASPGAGACYTAYSRIDEKGRHLGSHRASGPESLLEKLLFESNVVGPPSTLLVERKLLEAVGGFDPALSECADWDLWIRLARRTSLVYVDELLVEYREHASQMSRNTSLLEHDSVRVLEKAFGDPETPGPLRARAFAGMARNWMVLAGCYFRSGLYVDFVRCAARSVRLDPGQSLRLIGYPVRRLSSAARFRAS